MTTEIRFENEELDVRAYVDELGDVSLVLRLDDRGDPARTSYVSIVGAPDEVRRTLARLLGVTNAVAKGLEWMAALDEKNDEPGIVDTGTDWTDEERQAFDGEAAGGLKDAGR